jgi:tetratricopeptide (TPR) repeat protein
MSRIEKLLEYMKTSGKDSFLQHALALEYIKIGNHLGKLLERVGDFDKAIRIYKRGIEEAQKANDHHTRMELQGALEDIEE